MHAMLPEVQPEPRHVLRLDVAGVALHVRTADVEIFARLRHYFAPWVVPATEPPAVVVTLCQGAVAASGHFEDVRRPGGRRLKEAMRDVDGTRLVLKRATGVLMGLRPGCAWAVGDLRENLNQAINLVNACYARAVMARGHLLLHASAVAQHGRVVALAGPPGVGKSTASLHLVEAGYRFVTNDRLLALPVEGGVEALGYPKQPRVNPGTLLHHPRLCRLLPPAERAALAALPDAHLWELERKSDVDLDRVYGTGTVDLRGDLRALVLLRWSRAGAGFACRRLEVAEALAAVDLFHKDLGVFDLDAGLPWLAAPDVGRYAALLERLAVVEVTGYVRFAALTEVVADLLTAR
jgi:HprK-related kinase B